MTAPEFHFCRSCEQDRPRSAFGSNASRADGRNPRCKSCESQRKRISRATPEGKRQNVEATLRSRAKRATLNPAA